MANTREIRRRIKSIKGTGKITKAMELVSAVKMRKAVDRVLMTRPYANMAWEIIQNLVDKTDSSLHKLLEERSKPRNIGFVLISSNRGLCGVFNHQIIGTVADYIKKHKKDQDDIKADVILMGQKGRDIMFKHGHTIIAEFTKLDVTSKVEEILPMAKMLINDYMTGKYDRIVLCYTDYVSSLRQVARIKQLLPIKKEKDTILGEAGAAKEDLSEIQQMKAGDEYLFEPSASAVLDNILPRLIETQIYQAVLESDASEHSSRMLAMKNASEAADDLIQDLTLAYNQIRQAGITQEIAEISGTRAAMRN